MRNAGRASARGLSILALAVICVLVAGGCGAASANDSKLTIAYIDWDENVANSTLVKVLAEDELGYDVELEKSDLDATFTDLSDGKVDAFLDAWMPAHQRVIDKVGGGVVVSKEPWYVGKTRYGIAVPDYMKDVKSIADLNDSGVRVITGIDPGALLMARIRDRVIPDYGLRLSLVESSTPAMISELDRAYRSKKPVVFLAWSPHWMNVRYDFHYLRDPKGTMDGIVNPPPKLHSVYREGLKNDDAIAYALIDNMRLTEGQVNEMELEIVRAGSPQRGVRNWLEGNRDVVKPWVRAATAAGGMS